MKRLTFLAGLISALLLASASAQHSHSGHGAAQGHSPPSPYTGMQTRAIKALSDQEIADLRAGKGMSLALPAELNGYPGPSHVLELAMPLRLTEPQLSRTRALFTQMQEDARAAGEALIAAEATLDALFKKKQATAAQLSQATSRSAVAQGHLRETHLRYHLLMTEVLTEEQLALYQHLRGY